MYNWCPNLGTRYTPMRTPASSRPRRRGSPRITSVRSSATAGQLFGLEGPVYYTMGRMFDDPETNEAKASRRPSFATPPLARPPPDASHSTIGSTTRSRSTRSTSAPATRRGRTTQSTDCGEVPRRPVPATRIPLHAECDRANWRHICPQAEGRPTPRRCETRLALVRREFDYLRRWSASCT